MIRKTLLGLAASLAFASAAVAQDYPNRAIRFVVGYAAGGGPDITARATAHHLSKILGQPVIVENRLGAGGIVSAASIAKSAPDGYTLLVGETGQLGIVPHLSKSLPFDATRDFTPIALLSIQPLLIAAAGATPIRSMSDLVREARANPGKLNFGSSGIGTLHHLVMEMVKHELGLNIIHVPYKGSGQSVPALLGGEVQLLVTGIPNVMPHARAGTVHLLGVSSAARSEFAPDVPPIAEVVKGFDYTAEVGLLGPAGLPPEVLQRLTDALQKAFHNPDLLADYRKGGLTPKLSSPGAYAQLLKRNFEVYGKIVRIANVPAN